MYGNNVNAFTIQKPIKLLFKIVFLLVLSPLFIEGLRIGNINDIFKNMKIYRIEKRSVILGERGQAEGFSTL